MVDATEVPAAGNGKATKPRLVDNFYLDEEGNKAARPQPNVVAVGKRFLESNHTEVLRLEDLPAEQFRQAAAFGLQQVGQNAYGASKEEQERIELLQARWETILGGKWAGEGRESGIRVNDVIEAYLLAKQEKTGREPSAEDREKLRTGLENGEFSKEDLAENKLVAAKLMAIRAKRAAERAAKAADAAVGEAELPDLV